MGKATKTIIDVAEKMRNYFRANHKRSRKVTKIRSVEKI
jgi:hypothetical protein